MSTYKHTLANDTQEGWKMHGYEGWRPAMAYPYFVGFGLKKAKCGCGRVFKNVEDFYAHYLYQAIWLGESTVVPTQWTDLATQSTKDKK
jgi:hypothetical protein